jgi:uncharacterized protein YdhG (YjbR/CyaY superfamily)
VPNNPPQSVEDYLAAVPEEARAAVERLRETIKAAAPEATEIISYQIPTLKYQGPLVAFSAHKNHYSLHLMSPALMEDHKDELKPYTTTTATIHFPYDKPLPAALVETLVKARMEENEARPKGYGRHSRAEVKTGQ